MITRKIYLRLKGHSDITIMASLQKPALPLPLTSLFSTSLKT